MKMNKFLMLLGMLLLTTIAPCYADDDDDDDDELELEVTTPLRRSTALTKEYVSQIRAYQHIEVRALEKGYLQDIFVDEGQLVQEGQLMFKIMPNVYEAEYERAKAEANVARIEYQNTKSLAERNIVSANELATAEARLQKAEAEMNLAKTHLDFTEIRAPFTGIMDHLEVRKGSLVDEGELLTTLADVSKMWVYFNVPESEYLDYTENGMASKTVKLKLANGRIFDFEGTIETIQADFDNKTGNIAFRATFPNPNQILRHGQTGNVLMEQPYADALMIPQKATFEILDKTYVYVVNAEDKLEQRLITIGAEMPHVFLVTDGLQENDRILIEGLRRVRNGMKIDPDYEEPEEVFEDLDLYAE